MKEFLIQLAQQHENFRVCELEAMADMYGLDVDFSGHDDNLPFMIVKMKSCQDAIKLVEKTVLSKAVYELYAHGESYENVKDQVKNNYSYEYWRQYDNDSFRFEFISHIGSHHKDEQVKMVEDFSFMDLKGPIKMKNSNQMFALLDTWQYNAEKPDYIYFGRHLTDSHRKILDRYDLKKRKYIGTTSFEAELASVTCNIAQLTPGKFMYDPFAGTGSFLVSAGHCGALSVGTDIDVRMIKGKGQATIAANFKQYGLSPLFLDVMTMDFTHNAFRTNLKFDAIVCDPPYGVREGLKVLGSRDPERFKNTEKTVIDGELAHLRKDYIPPKKPYQFNTLLDDLLQFAADHLVEKGRLCFWMPTSATDYKETDIPLHPDLEYTANCEQKFNKWSRRLVVFTRRKYGEKGDSHQVTGTAPEEFRAKYFRAFRE